MFSESSLTCGLRSDEDDVKTGCKNVKLFFVEPLATGIRIELLMKEGFEWIYLKRTKRCRCLR